MTLSQQAILALVQRDAMTLAHTLANKADHKPAGFILRAVPLIADMVTEPDLVPLVRGLLRAAQGESTLVYSKQLITSFCETFDYGVDSVKRIAA